ncbi:asparaginase [soil metagenome]
MPEDVRLVDIRRGPLTESVHRGWLVVCNPNGEILDANGDPNGYTYVRSSAKPFQAVPLVLSGAADALALTDEEIAIACASHSGEEQHLSLVRSILSKAGLSESHLQSGTHRPFYGPASASLARNGVSPSALHGNCSGKHAGMLALCVYEGWSTEDYRKPEHPVQRRILEIVAEVCGISRDEVLLGGDGCGVPSFAMPLRSLATGFARLATSEGLSDDLAEACGRVRRSMRANPYLVGGTGRFDTDLMGDTDLVVKGGAEGVFACGSPDGWGMALKISDGSSRAVKPTALSTLSRQGVALSEKMQSELYDLHGAIVGEIFPLA